MSSRPEPPDLEGFIDYSFYFDRLAPGTRERLIAFYEPHRARIEYAMNEDYDPETMSWRDWRNAYWNHVLPEYPKEITMSDEEARALERQVIASGDPGARLKLTGLRLRRRTGVVWVWIEVPLHTPMNFGGPPAPTPVARPPAGTIEVTLHGYATGGETVFGGGPQPPATPKRAWVLACMSVEAGVFGREDLPSTENVSGPHLLDIGAFKLASVHATEKVFLEEPSVSVQP